MRKLLTTLWVVGGLVAALPVQAQQSGDYPNRPIKIIVCLPAGGGVDTVTRIVADKMQSRLGQPIVIENRSGQSGNLGAEAVFNSEPDGYTLLASQPAPITINPLLYKTMNFDPAQFVPVGVMSHIPNTLMVRNNFPAKTVAEFLAYAKANPGKLNYASQGNGTTSHLTAELFNLVNGTKLMHVPYRGTAPALNDLVAGHVDIFFNEFASAAEQHKAGRARILAVTTPERVPQLPDIPTLHELGMKDFVSDTWNAISAPPKTPAAVIAKLNAALNDALKSPELRAQFEHMGLLPGGGAPAEMGSLVKSETQRWGDVIRKANVTLQQQ